MATTVIFGRDGVDLFGALDRFEHSLPLVKTLPFKASTKSLVVHVSGHLASSHYVLSPKITGQTEAGYPADADASQYQGYAVWRTILRTGEKSVAIDEFVLGANFVFTPYSPRPDFSRLDLSILPDRAFAHDAIDRELSQRGTGLLRALLDKGTEQIGSAGDDVFYAMRGTDIIRCGTGANQIVVRETRIGHDTVRHFDADNAHSGHDTIVIAPKIAGSFQQLRSKIVQSGNDSVIRFDADNSLTLEGVALRDLDAGDFRFADAPRTQPVPPTQPVPEPTSTGTILAIALAVVALEALLGWYG